MMGRRDVFSLALGWALPAVVDDLTEGDRLLLETTQILGVVAGSTDKLSVVNQYMAQRQKVTAYLETIYPGQTVDWSVIPAVLKAKP